MAAKPNHHSHPHCRAQSQSITFWQLSRIKLLMGCNPNLITISACLEVISPPHSQGSCQISAGLACKVALSEHLSLHSSSIRIKVEALKDLPTQASSRYPGPVDRISAKLFDLFQLNNNPQAQIQVGISPVRINPNSELNYISCLTIIVFKFYGI
jgi:hypothetical protein